MDIHVKPLKDEFKSMVWVFYHEGGFRSPLLILNEHEFMELIRSAHNQGLGK